jgi:hypothetical protein
MMNTLPEKRRSVQQNGFDHFAQGERPERDVRIALHPATAPLPVVLPLLTFGALPEYRLKSP